MRENGWARDQTCLARKNRSLRSCRPAPRADLWSVQFTASWLFASLCVSSVGLGLFVYGKKQTRIPQLVAGVALLLESAFVSSSAWMLAVAVLVIGALWAAVRAGL